MTGIVSPAEFASLKTDMGDMKALMQRMVDAMTKLALLDERQQGMFDTNREILRRLDGIESRQHAAELVGARTADSAGRLQSLETMCREMHVDRERDKARFGTVVWMVRGLWAVAGSGLFMAAYQLFHSIPK